MDCVKKSSILDSFHPRKDNSDQPSTSLCYGTMVHSPVKERSFWNRIYCLIGKDRKKELYSKYIDDFTYIGYHLRHRLENLHGQNILSMGGGYDRLAVILARQGNRVTSMDISDSAIVRTTTLARKEGLLDRMVFKVGNIEELQDESAFDVVLCKRCLHHVDIHKVLPRIVVALKKGGRFIAEEPVCLSKILDFLHEHVPVHTKPYIDGEVQFNEVQLTFFREHFPELRIEYFDFLTREVIAYILYRLRGERLLLPLGRFDYHLVNEWFPALRKLSSFAILEATR